jgi:hypothetical protein
LKKGKCTVAQDTFTDPFFIFKLPPPSHAIVSPQSPSTLKLLKNKNGAIKMREKDLRVLFFFLFFMFEFGAVYFAPLNFEIVLSREQKTNKSHTTSVAVVLLVIFLFL